MAMALTLALGLVGCGKSGENADKGVKKTIEVSFFEGGFGLTFFQDVARKYEKAHPGVKVNLWGDPRNGGRQVHGHRFQRQGGSTASRDG